MVSGRNEELLRGVVGLFYPLRIALLVNDCICYIFRSIVNFCSGLFEKAFRLTLNLVKRCFRAFLDLLEWLNITNETRRSFKYKRIGESKLHFESEPYSTDPIGRFLTYHLGLVLGAALYVFVYFVLIKHHSLIGMAIALSLMLVYMIVLENSHNLRCVLMLCLPIMFTNRGRALIFCSMLSLMLAGPFTNLQANTSQLDKSLNCCKQFLIIKTDKFIDENVMQDIVRVEKLIGEVITHIKQFADDMRERFKVIMRLALTVEQYVERAIRRMREIVNVCNTKTQGTYDNCVKIFTDAYDDCLDKMGSFSFLCSVVKPLTKICGVVKLPNVLCQIPKSIVQFIDQTLGQQLRAILLLLENEFYVDVDINHVYSYNATKTKSYKTIVRQVRTDIARKFWYATLVAKVFNLLSLVLVIWIIFTAASYQMHYLSEIGYDNMYLDKDLARIDDYRKSNAQQAQSLERHRSASSDSSATQDASLDIGQTVNAIAEADRTSSDLDGLVAMQSLESSEFLFPMAAEHERLYLRPFSLRMNEFERSKIFVSTLVWFVIVSYILMFLVLDFSMYKLMQVVTETLDDMLFASDLPIVDVTSKTDDQIVRYNRTYLNQLREQNNAIKRDRLANANKTMSTGGLSGLYRRLMDSVEENIPDDIAILDSLEQCLPRARRPNVYVYKHLSHLVVLTFAAVIMESYALRLRHCIANLYYPERANSRAIWLYDKLLAEKPKYANLQNQVAATDKPSAFDWMLDTLMLVFRARINR